MISWREPVLKRELLIAECPDCKCNTIVLICFVDIKIGLFCSKCLGELNDILIYSVSGDELFQKTGCKIVTAPLRYNLKINPNLSYIYEVRWREI